jgi:hypothetical protein
VSPPTVTELSKSSGASEVVSNSGRTIVGAGVSTCAPITIN